MQSNNLKKSVKRNKRVLNRAKLFLSYDALKGFKERIHEKERIIVEKPVLLEDQLYELDWKIKQIKVGMMINIIYFSMKQTLMIIQLQSVGLSLIMIKFVCVVMVKSL